MYEWRNKPENQFKCPRCNGVEFHILMNGVNGSTWIMALCCLCGENTELIDTYGEQ